VTKKPDRPPRILLVEDNPADVVLLQEVFEEVELECELSVAYDGEEALDLLFRRGEHADARRPDFVLLDLNMPKVSGREVLTAIKHDEDLRTLPVIILTSSKADDDIAQCYRDHANCYLAKPGNLDEYLRIVDWIRRFWLTIVELPNEE